jgi:hypothetical protein
MSFSHGIQHLIFFAVSLCFVTASAMLHGVCVPVWRVWWQAGCRAGVRTGWLVARPRGGTGPAPCPSGSPASGGTYSKVIARSKVMVEETSYLSSSYLGGVMFFSK